MNEQFEAKDIDRIEAFFDDYASDFSGIYQEDENPRSRFNLLIDKIFRQAIYSRFEKTLKYTQNSSIKTILDIGCGPGHYVMAFLKQQKKVTALDISENMLNLTKGRVNKTGKEHDVTYILNDYMEQQFEGKFDASVVMGFFEYVEDPVPFIKKLIKDTKKEIYLSVAGKKGWQATQRKVRYWLKDCPLYLVYKNELKQVLSDAGCLEQPEIIEIDQGWFVVIRPRV